MIRFIIKSFMLSLTKQNTFFRYKSNVLQIGEIYRLLKTKIINKKRNDWSISYFDEVLPF